MSLCSFQLLRPRSVDEAVQALSAHRGEAKILAGGTDVIPNLQMKLFSPRVLVDLKSVAGLRGIQCSTESGLRIGAMTTLAEIVNSTVIKDLFPVLHSAVTTVAGPLQRNMGTIGGNLCLETRCRWYNQSEFWRNSLGGCLKKDGDICHVAPGGKFCWAAWSGDSAPAFLALAAEIEVTGPNGARTIPLHDFYRNDGMDRIALASDELLTAVHVPSEAAGWRGVYLKLRVRNSIDYPLAGVAVAMDVDARGICRGARVALSAVNPAPRLIPQASEALLGRPYSPEIVSQIAQAAIRTGKPLTTSASTPIYRREILRLFTKRALEETWRGNGNGARG